MTRERRRGRSARALRRVALASFAIGVAGGATARAIGWSGRDGFRSTARAGGVETTREGVGRALDPSSIDAGRMERAGGAGGGAEGTEAGGRAFWARVRADAARRDAVKAAMRECFEAYVRYARGHDELAPNSRVGRDDFGGVGATLVDALDTLFVMGMRREFDEALGMLKAPGSAFGALIHGEVDRDVSVFETNIRILGGLLSAHDLSGDADALELAESFAARLSAAFDTPSGIPRSFVNVKTGRAFALPWTQGKSILADFGSMHLEWSTLSARTKNPVYEAHTAHVFEQIASARQSSGAPHGLFPHLYDVDAGRFAGGVVSFGALGDSFYEYLIKCWRSLGDLKDSQTWREMFDAAMEGMKTTLLHEWKREGEEVFSFLSPVGGSGPDSMEHLACFAPGMLVLGAAEAPTQALADEYVEIAKSIARTCVAMYDSQPSGLAPDHVRLLKSPPSVAIIDAKNIQRPETVESLFYLYRKTGDQEYRDAAWKIFQSMKKAYRVPESGWQGIRDVSSSSPQGDDKMQSFFLAETLKYLYLIFCDGDVMHLDEWVFNTEAHPFRITKTRRS